MAPPCTSILFRGKINARIFSYWSIYLSFVDVLWLITCICRAVKTIVGGFPRPLIDLSAGNFAKVFNDAFGYPLVPPFDPYRDSISFMLASYVIPYVGLVAYVGTNPNINGYVSKRVSWSTLTQLWYLCEPDKWKTSIYLDWISFLRI